MGTLADGLTRHAYCFGFDFGYGYDYIFGCFIGNDSGHDVYRRAGARKSGRDGEVRHVKPEERVDHMPHTQHYPVEDVLVDLLEVSDGVGSVSLNLFGI